MPSPLAESESIGPERIWLVAWAAFGVAMVECVAVVLMVRQVGVALPVGWQAYSFVLSLTPPILAGFVIHAVVRAFLGGGKEYLREIVRPRKLALTLLLFITLIVLTVFYADLKVMTPLLTDRSFDELLWRIDSLLFFGMSPNVFFVNLMNHSALLRFIDFGYGYFFFFSVLVSFPLFFPLRDDRLRVSFIVANVALWSCGAWLYYIFPSLGPAYRFHEIWDLVREQFPVSTYWQKQLIDNYRMVLEIPRGHIDPGLNLVEGIGAFPSLHVGFQALFALYLGGLSRIARGLVWLLVFLTFLGSILTGWHYMIDSIAGLAIALVIWSLMEGVVLAERKGPSGEEA